MWFGASWMVDSASRIAKKFGLSDLVIGLTVVAIATSAPEFAVTVSAALKNQPSISVGNVVGSNIFNLGIILGLISLFSKVDISPKMLYRDGGLLVTTTILLLFFFYDLTLSSFEGIILALILVSYVIFLIKNKQEIDEEIDEKKFTFWDVPKLFFGIAVIIISANYLVESSINIARFFGISEWIIGVTIVGAGTSMPEFATSVVAISKKKHAISAGNLIGSDLFNMLGVLGIAAFLHPLSIEPNEYISLILMSASVLVLVLLMRRRWKISKFEAVIIIAIALFRWIYDFIY
ncbi:MAG: calcium/sodium antiporter [Ignavibacteriales bacterium]|nr:calcium/sodium antiporter [Ignavibacteriota bacterium]MCB9248015.1 calcium/sodium antiporter [Ignavibacteriales bacterium]